MTLRYGRLEPTINTLARTTTTTSVFSEQNTLTPTSFAPRPLVIIPIVTPFSPFS